MSGVVNAVSPRPVTNAEFTRTLASVVRRPAILNVPGFAWRAVAGELAEELLLTDQHVISQRLQRANVPCYLGELEDTLRFELGARTWSDSAMMAES